MGPRAGGAPPDYFSRSFSLARLSLAQLVRSPSHSRRAQAARQWARHSLALTAAGAAIVAALMFALDAREIVLMPARGTAVLWPLRILTDFGKAAYVLEALAATLFVILIVAPALPRSRRLLLITFGTRIQFLFFAVLIPIFAGEVLKITVGRGRPLVGGEPNAFYFSHFAWTESYASFPSGHAITSFALAFAVSAVWPATRTTMIIYAFVIAVTRLVLLAHHPSDVVAGALLGVIGAMFVRYWFAARHLAFKITRDGEIEPLGGMSWERLKSLFPRRLFPESPTVLRTGPALSTLDRSNKEL